MRYHLGCGSMYLQGYTNVDFPPSEHNVNHNVKVDMYANVLEMCYESCDEIRSHHMFEHFNYPDAFFLLRQWTLALKESGLLWVGVPDVGALAKALVNSPSLEKTFKIMRYMYGSHEASWAYHINGWTPYMLSSLLGDIGYTTAEVKEDGDIESPQPNCSFDIKAIKVKTFKSEEIDLILQEKLGLYKNGSTDFENSLHKHLSQQYLSRIK